MTLIPETKAKTTSTDNLEKWFTSKGWKPLKPGWAKGLWEGGKKASEHYQKYGPEVPYGAVSHPKQGPGGDACQAPCKED